MVEIPAHSSPARPRLPTIIRALPESRKTAPAPTAPAGAPLLVFPVERSKMPG